MWSNELRRQASQQIGIFGDLRAVQVELEVPAEIDDALPQRLDHVPGDDGVGPARQGKADAAYSGLVERFQLRVGDRWMDDRDAPGARPQLCQRVDRHAIIGRVVARRHHHDPRRSRALLEQPIVLHGGIFRPRAARTILGKAGIVDVHVAVGGIRRRFDLGRLDAERVGHRRLGAAHARPQRAGSGQCRRSGQKGPTTDGSFIHGAAPVICLPRGAR
jgi:hypothetical protein